jgi:TorA maturation chaperone TorD
MNSAGESLSPEQRFLLQQAAEWRLIGLLFECPAGPWREQLVQLKAEIVNPVLRQSVEAAQAEASEGMYHSLFGPGGPVPLREVTYHGGVEAGHLLSHIAGYYQAFAYRPETMEADDHLSVETGFIAYLMVKEAYALSCGDPEHASLAAEARQSFLADHLSTFVAPLLESLHAAAPTYLILAAEALQVRLESKPHLGSESD